MKHGDIADNMMDGFYEIIPAYIEALMEDYEHNVRKIGVGPDGYPVWIKLLMDDYEHNVRKIGVGPDGYPVWCPDGHPVWCPDGTKSAPSR